MSDDITIRIGPREGSRVVWPDGDLMLTRRQLVRMRWCVRAVLDRLGGRVVEVRKVKL